MTDFTLEELAATIGERAASGDDNSYTARLVGKGVAKCAQKLGEEAVEAAIAAVSEDKEGLTKEAADVLYHLLVLLHAAGVSFDEVKAELAQRTGQSGLEEKRSRPASANWKS
ncbi:phosphoribosyl-ATP diphosphatase [Afifella marina]|uniref:Phosphoribosyl-ATP pyrophosphatase n=1 Tax=Afifella marina DSM 2698 TaxID=1120955 RepID=A0A1G5NDQ8_AFIMA|nr:phosphoribosyl-ATP diphosphatase [Afifella marina]MBK1623381.1 phosphoribosyl-ATP diphosphatase [Afifella marina DSM 2698]MBK1626375.1 phosphoribosyl-ATP diphosphatase [Afifella marina]MBK5917253.1 phosphoribosyl-ATP diphosphatase [Afifella marina]RAI18092.1 phosphoribosyl-ATP diphosphatase [Afifella marina DSM 2698]SCZ35547.1 phosphoribosyl-ATP pyrophosphatase [Afifella marina DSM 2698]